MAVVSGDSEGSSDDEDIFDNKANDPKDSDLNSQGDELLYDERLDDEDETYVNEQLRGVKKPRNSDAILSCPCCFRILSLDTQQHYKYANQFRAMFVMGIAVDWQHRLKYDNKAQGLVRWDPPAQDPQANKPRVVASDQGNSQGQSEDPIYYAVSCANCHTQVAALDMADEVYHFYDCLASA